jgi:CheY-like chemotaxis protein
MSPKTAQDTFVNALRRALHRLYDPAELRRNPLFELLGLPAGADRVGALRKTLQEAIRALKPGPQAPSDSQAARIYEILTYRFIEQSSQKEVAADLAVSTRQLQRLEAIALETLGEYLANRFQLELDKTASRPSIEPEAAETLDRSNVPAWLGAPGQAQLTEGEAARAKIAQELAWLERSSHLEEIDSGVLLHEILDTLRPLTENLSAPIAIQIPDPAPFIAGDQTILRQAFLTLLSTLIHTCPGGRVNIQAWMEGARVRVEIGANSPAMGAVDSAWLEQEDDLLQQLIHLTGGEMKTERISGVGYLASLYLPGIASQSILALDDNADALALLDRYLTGSRYKFEGTRTPAQFFSLAEAGLPSAFILDVMLPGTDGWQILGRLKAAPRTRPIPVVVSTILPQETLAIMLGADAFLRKPFTRKDLLDLLDRLLQPEPG